ncbi:unnamed protein product [Strongylus vulgaris]|uniref:Uncharacterized protein n=1 Tax=Strongylus vulgaris TaxID=40348 RepID=A0A3P7LKD5_STRVU|nr:unnamed protein product [Strongylus vulgaris]
MPSFCGQLTDAEELVLHGCIVREGKVYINSNLVRLLTDEEEEKIENLMGPWIERTRRMKDSPNKEPGFSPLRDISIFLDRFLKVNPAVTKSCLARIRLATQTQSYRLVYFHLVAQRKCSFTKRQPLESIQICPMLFDPYKTSNPNTILSSCVFSPDRPAEMVIYKKTTFKTHSDLPHGTPLQQPHLGNTSTTTTQKTAKPQGFGIKRRPKSRWDAKFARSAPPMSKPILTSQENQKSKMSTSPSDTVSSTGQTLLQLLTKTLTDSELLRTLRELEQIPAAAAAPARPPPFASMEGYSNKEDPTVQEPDYLPHPVMQWFAKTTEEPDDAQLSALPDEICTAHMKPPSTGNGKRRRDIFI